MKANLLARWAREPLVHFLVIGALLFGAFQWRGGGPASTRIVITPGQVDAIVAGFTRTWMRPPTPEELKGQLDEYVREEIASREAMAMGLDRDDTIIRRRLRQKLEFLAEDAVDLAPPTDAELQAFLDTHEDTYSLDTEVAFRQVCLSPDRRGASLDADARALRVRLSRAPADAAIDALGDSVMLPQEVTRSTRTDIERQFGKQFADDVLKIEPGRWAGPIRSGYGLHVVFVREREAGRALTLAEARPQLERDFTQDRRRKQLDAMYKQLLDRYQVVIETRPQAPK
jgi:hypothetical protein